MCGYKRGIFSQAVPGDKIRVHTMCAENFSRRHRNRKDRRLSIGCELKFRGRPFKTQFREWKTKSGIGFFKNFASFGKFLRQLAAHPGILGTLTGKNECCLWQMRRPLSELNHPKK